MLEFQKLCAAFEKMSYGERSAVLSQKSAHILAALQKISLPESNAVQVLAGFIIGAVTADGRVNEKEYLIIYPALAQVFGADFNFAAVKASFKCDRDGCKAIAAYTEKLLQLFSNFDETLKSEIITLCLCIVAMDGKVSIKEKRYIRRLCN